MTPPAIELASGSRTTPDSASPRLVGTTTDGAHTHDVSSPPARAAIALLDQARRVIESLDDHCYTAPSGRIAGGTIGKHFRHCLDHFAAALWPLASGAGGSAQEVIDYDHRDRNVPMETDRQVAINEIRSVREAIRRTSEADMPRRVVVRVMLTSDGQEADLPSTFGRELAFAAHHAIHHHAMIKSIAEEFGAALPPEFGKAPATLAYEQH